MKIKLISVLVNDQNTALTFYTKTLGFTTKSDIPMGEFRWLTVVSPEEPNGTQLLLEPMSFGPAKRYQQELFKAGIPIASFHVDDMESEYQRLVSLGVRFSVPPTRAGATRMAVFEDTCGNHIQIAQV